ILFRYALIVNRYLLIYSKREVGMSERKYKHPQVILRIPSELRDKIAELAEANGRSSNQEMTIALESWVEENKNIGITSISGLNRKIESLEMEIIKIKKSLSID
ncbi:Arc family DNA-binding protein, partial [Proteus mirabilis]|uniref:Arc family DNA-binding protein n=1 Tax=Proteus mirabilis TaxID=584 RepID=UPI00391AFD8D